MYTLTVKIAKAGTVKIDADGKPMDPSTAGHMWYSLSDGSSSKCYGFGGMDGSPIDDEKMFDDDDSAYQSTIYTAAIVIEQWQYDGLHKCNLNKLIRRVKNED
jgi:hypothetical protein